MEGKATKMEETIETNNLVKMALLMGPRRIMELISLQGKTNFFEKRVGDYQKAGVTSDKESQTFSLDEDF